MLQVLLISIVLVGIAFLALGLNIFFTKRSFPETEVGHNKKMKELGISCAKCDEWKSFRKKRKFTNLKLDVSKLEIQ